MLHSTSAHLLYSNLIETPEHDPKYNTEYHITEIYPIPSCVFLSAVIVYLHGDQNSLCNNMQRWWFPLDIITLVTLCYLHWETPFNSTFPPTIIDFRLTPPLLGEYTQTDYILKYFINRVVVY